MRVAQLSSYIISLIKQGNPWTIEMADWNESLFQIITAVIGGSVFAFVLNAANTDFNQPHFVITFNNTHSY